MKKHILELYCEALQIITAHGLTKTEVSKRTRPAMKRLERELSNESGSGFVKPNPDNEDGE